MGDSGGVGWSDLSQQKARWDANPAPGPPPAGSQTRLCGCRAVRSRGVVSRIIGVSPFGLIILIDWLGRLTPLQKINPKGLTPLP